jgi:DNA-binding CsgD family transcriptional regulator
MRTSTGTSGTPVLTGRQKQILDLLTANMTSRQIANRLGIHSRTVDNHCVNIIRVLGVRDRFDAVRHWTRTTLRGDTESHECA